MQTFQLPKHVLKKMDRMNKNFFWGFDDSNNNRFHLKSWKSICTPKEIGGLGVRRLVDVNKALLTKLAWEVNIEGGKTWTQLIRAKYLRSRRLLNSNLTRQSYSWFWGGIKGCLDTLRKGYCFQIGKSSTIRIRDDPWLPSIPGFQIPEDTNIPLHIQVVSDLMYPEGSQWDQEKVCSIFNPQLSKIICETPILDAEHERLIWAPSTSGKFSVKSAYKLLIQECLSTSPQFPKKLWQLVWSSNLHTRHALLLWKMISHVIPTLDRLNQRIPLDDTNCYLCGNMLESVDHLALKCPLSRLLWWLSPWNIKLDNFRDMEFPQWVMLILSPSDIFPLEKEDRNKMIQFLPVMLERVWLTRNCIWKGKPVPNWQELSKMVNSNTNRYLAASVNRERRRKSSIFCNVGALNSVWKPPREGEYKMNFDAAFINGRAVTACILRNSVGTILGAWIGRFSSENPFCAEAEAAVQVLKLSKDLGLDEVTIEGDATFVIFALLGCSQYEDWRAKSLIVCGKALLARRLGWKVLFTPRDCNSHAHFLAKWAFSLDFCGAVPTQLLDPSLWGVRVGNQRL